MLNSDESIHYNHDDGTDANIALHVNLNNQIYGIGFGAVGCKYFQFFIRGNYDKVNGLIKFGYYRIGSKQMKPHICESYFEDDNGL